MKSRFGRPKSWPREPPASPVLAACSPGSDSSNNTDTDSTSTRHENHHHIPIVG